MRIISKQNIPVLPQCNVMLDYISNNEKGKRKSIVVNLI